MPDNVRMELSGRVHNGIVVLDGGAVLPEGVAVSVIYPPRADVQSTPHKLRLVFPLVRSANPGSLDLTNERIAEILDHGDGTP